MVYNKSIIFNLMGLDKDSLDHKTQQGDNKNGKGKGACKARQKSRQYYKF